MVRSDVDLETLNAQVEAAIARGSPDGLRIIGYGEVTLVIAWPRENPRYAIKRLALFSSQKRFDDYAALVTIYCQKLEARGVGVVDTQVQGIAGADGQVRGYLVQPFIAKEQLLTHIMRHCTEPRGRELLDELARLICTGINDEVGMDAAIPNWALVDGRFETFDISTPWLRDGKGRDLIDLDHLLQVYPWIVRGLLKRFVFNEILDGVHSPRLIILDTAVQMLRWGNENWLDLLLEVANPRLDEPVTRKQVEDRFAFDLRIYPLMDRLRKLDRWWQKNVRRRPYGTLLPNSYDKLRREGEQT